MWLSEPREAQYTRINTHLQNFLAELEATLEQFSFLSQ